MGNHLALNVLGTQDTIVVKNWYSNGNQFHMEQIKTSDGKTLLDGQVHNLVQAMSGFVRRLQPGRPRCLRPTRLRWHPRWRPTGSDVTQSPPLHTQRSQRRLGTQEGSPPQPGGGPGRATSHFRSTKSTKTSAQTRVQAMRSTRYCGRQNLCINDWSEQP